MSLETFGFISDLVPTNPTGSDPRSQGDDHLRGIKATLQATFPHADSAINIKPDATKLTLGVGAEDALQIDATAKTIRALAPYQMAGNGPAFSAYKSGAIQGIPGGPTTPIVLESEEFDTADAFASSAFTCPVAGFYQLSGSVAFAAGTGYGHSAILVDDIVTCEGTDVSIGAVSNNSNVNGLVFLSVGSVVRLGAYSNGSINVLASQAAVRLSGTLVRIT